MYATAEVVSAVQKTRKIGLVCKAVTGLAAAAALAGVVTFAGVELPGLQPRSTDVVLLPPQKVHFRSQAEAPLKPDAPGASADWVDSAMTITVMPVAFVHRTEPGRKARIVSETLDVSYGGKPRNIARCMWSRSRTRRVGTAGIASKAMPGPRRLSLADRSAGRPCSWRRHPAGRSNGARSSTTY